MIKMAGKPDGVENFVKHIFILISIVVLTMILNCKAIQGQPGLKRWTLEMNFGINHALCAGSIAQRVDLVQPATTAPSDGNIRSTSRPSRLKFQLVDQVYAYHRPGGRQRFLQSLLKILNQRLALKYWNVPHRYTTYYWKIDLNFPNHGRRHFLTVNSHSAQVFCAASSLWIAASHWSKLTAADYASKRFSQWQASIQIKWM